MRLREALVVGFTAAAIPGFVTAGWLARDSWRVWRHAGAVAAAAVFLEDTEFAQTALAVETGQLGAALRLATPDAPALPSLATATDDRLRVAAGTATLVGFDPDPMLRAGAAMTRLRRAVALALARPMSQRDPDLSREVLVRRDEQIARLGDSVDRAAALLERERPGSARLVEIVYQVMEVRYTLGRRNLVMIGWWNDRPVPLDELIEVERMTASIHQAWATAKRLIAVTADASLRAEAARQDASFLAGDEPHWERLIAFAHSRLGAPARLPDWPETLASFRDWSNAGQARVLVLRDTALAAITRGTRQESQAARQRLLLAALLTCVICIASVVAIALLLRGIVLPMDGLTRSIRRITGGELDLAVQGAGRRDEIGEMARAVLLLRDAAAERERLLTTDPLTGALNRRAGARLLEEAFRTWRQRGRGFAVLLVDVDHFKSINDRWGHETGDRVLVALTVACRATLRDDDATIRWGGEEFLLLLPQANVAAAVAVAERLRGAIAAGSLLVEGDMVAVTVSIGVAAPVAGDLAADDVVRRADGVLYLAKRSGRNRVEAAVAARPAAG